MPDPKTPITFVIPGHRAGATRGAATASPLPGGLRSGTVETSVRVGSTRDAGMVQFQAIPGVHVVVISIEGGPDLVLHPDVARELLAAQEGAPTRSAGTVVDGAVVVPATLRWKGVGPATPGARGITDFVGGIVIKAVDVVSGVMGDVFTDAATDAASLFAVRKLAEKVDGQVTEGVYHLRADKLADKTPLAKVPASADPMLVFIHGTFSSTTGGFGALWAESPERTGQLFDPKKGYGNRVYALDHATLGASPVKNALTLAEALPNGARLHLVTHSRGGLVAEVLAQLCARPTLNAKALAAFSPGERDELQQLHTKLRDRAITVERVVRVGGPIRGTLLASKRLDAYLSVLSWSTKAAGWPVVPEVVDFLGAVARHRLDPEVLPGLAAQVPGSPLVQLLHADETPIPGELRVIAGDIQGDSVLTWVKTLMSDAYYWTDNDAVVQTSSMYGGARRTGGASFVLDRGGSVLHTKYFLHNRAADAVFSALEPGKSTEFRPVGPLSWAGKDASGVRAGATTAAIDDGKRPAVFLIPGVGASRLRRADRLVWPAAMAASTIADLTYTDGDLLTADSFVGDTFDALDTALASTHRVIRFPYDWRAPLELEAGRLAERIGKACDARAGTRQPVRLLTHSSGALLVRLLALDHQGVWERVVGHPEGRVVMLAPPNRGTWMPMQILSGDDTFGGLLTNGAPPLGEPLVRDAFGTMPGVLQLQADLFDSRHALADPTSWAKLASADAMSARAAQTWHNVPSQVDQHRWGHVNPWALQRAVSLRQKLDDAPMLPPAVAARIAIVVGAGTPTPDGLAEEPTPPGPTPAPLAYLDSLHGDGRVTIDRATLPGVATFVLDAEHAALPSLRDALPGIVELLGSGRTDQLPLLPATPAADGVRGRSRVSRLMRPPVPSREADILSTRRDAAPAGMGTGLRRALPITVEHGDLMFVREPLLIGHYRAMRLTGAEQVVDRLIGCAMSRSLEMGVYPEPPATWQIFLNTYVAGADRIRLPRPKAVVVVGLGEEGALTAADLVQTVRQGAIAWALRAAEGDNPPATVDLAATLIASGGKGFDVWTVAPLLAEAVSDADTLLEAAGLPRVGGLRIIELYQDRAHDALESLLQQAAHQPDRYQVTPTVVAGAGALRRTPGTHYRGADYDFVSIAIRNATDGSELAYSLDTRRARTEVVRQGVQMSLLQQLLAYSNRQPAPPDIGRTLFNTLIPIQLEAYVSTSTDIVLELDEHAAGLPWELLDTSAGARGQVPVPWAIRSKIVRKLRVESIEPPRRDTNADDYVLVIGEPKCDPDKYLRLAGARLEATAVADVFEAAQGRVERVIAPDDERQCGPDSVEVLSALHRHPYRIIHIAGHGEATITGRTAGGVVLSPFEDGKKKQETYLGADEIRGLRAVPELVFINCCHVGARERLQLLEPTSPLLHRYNRPAFAAGVADELIRLGVRCVIAAGWAVDDEAARVFATTFYGAILTGTRFIEATAMAREATQALGGTTWAAFQCWGDPEWTYRSQIPDAQGRTDVREDVASADALVIVLDALRAQAKYHPEDEDLPCKGRPRGGDKTPDTKATGRRRRLAALEERYGSTWGAIGRVADAFGSAYFEAGDLAKAAAWYARAIAANDGTASLRAAEQLANLTIRTTWKRVSSLKGGAGMSKEDRAALTSAAQAIQEAAATLTAMLSQRRTLEMGSLLGSAHKRLAMVFARLGDAVNEAQALDAMRNAYAKAEEYGKDDPGVFYPAWQKLVSTALVVAGTGKGLKTDDVAAYRRLLERKDDADQDFWSAVAFVELDLVQAVAAGTLAENADALADRFRRVAERVPSPGMWNSVHDNATFVLDIYRRRLEKPGTGKRAATRPVAQAELSAIDTTLDSLAVLAGHAATAPPPKKPRRK